LTRRGAFSVRPALAAVLVMAGAFLVRVLHVVSYVAEPTNDATVYVDTAVRRLTWANLFSPEGICWFPPGYSLFLKPFLLIFERYHALLAAEIAQAALGAWTCLLVYRLGARIHSRKAGLAAALMTCFYPHLLFYSSVYLSETLFTACFLAGLLAFIRAAAKPSPRRWYLAGLVAAVGTLVRPAEATLAPAALLAIAKASPDRKGKLKAAGLVLAGGLTLIAPWALRNWIAYDHFVLVSPNDAFNLAIGNHPDARGGYVSPPSISSNLWGRSADWRQRAISFVTNDPWGALYIVFKLKWKEFWSFIPPWPLFTSNPSLFYGEHVFAFFPWRLVLPLGLAGIGALAAGRRRAWWLTPACLACYVALYMAFFGDTRFRIPVEAFFLVWSGCAIAEVATRWRPLRSTTSGAWGAATSLLLALILAEGGVFGVRARSFLASPASLVAEAGQVAMIPNQRVIQVLGEEGVPISRSRGRFLRVRFAAYRQGPPRDTPDNGRVSLRFLDSEGRSGSWLDNTGYTLEAVPPDRWVPIGFKAHIPPWAERVKLEVYPWPGSPDSVILDQFTVRYARANSLVLEEIFPYLRYRE